MYPVIRDAPFVLAEYTSNEEIHRLADAGGYDFVCVCPTSNPDDVIPIADIVPVFDRVAWSWTDDSGVMRSCYFASAEDAAACKNLVERCLGLDEQFYGISIREVAWNPFAVMQGY